jgi:hypothetical protein
MPYPVESKTLNHNESLDEDEFRHLISVWQTSRNTKHVLRRLRDDPNFFDTRGIYVHTTYRREDNSGYDPVLHDKYKFLIDEGVTCSQACKELGIDYLDDFWEPDGRCNPTFSVVDVPAHQKVVPLDVKWLRGLERKLRKMDIPLKKLKTPQSNSDLYLNAEGLKNLAMSLAS